MAVKIDMEMPECCMGCKFHQFEFKEFWPRPLMTCTLLRGEIAYNKRRDDCPLQEVKE